MEQAQRADCGGSEREGKLTERQAFLHDLALALGMTVADVESRMTAREFDLWQRYAIRRMLPWRRMELLLAQIARMVGITMGGVSNETPLTEFLFEGVDDEDDEDMTAEEFFGFAPRKKPAAEVESDG